MLSRTAESFFWIGRYFERAEYIARFTDVNYHLLLEFSNWEDQAQTWSEYLDANGELSLFESLYGQVSTRAVLEFLALNPQNPNSILNLVQLARVNSRGIQDQLSSEVWGHINDFHLNIKEHHPKNLWPSPHRFLTHIQHMCYTADGVMGSTMLHDEGWNFYRLGKNIERANRMARLLDDPVLVMALPEPSGISEHHQCLAILKSASAYEAYRKFYRSQLIPRKIVQFLLFHNKFPRSVRFAANLIRQMLHRLSSGIRSADVRETERLAGQFASDLEFGSLEEVYKMGLSHFLTDVIDQIDRITNQIARTFFRSDGYSDQPIPSTQKRRRPAIRQAEPRRETHKATLSVRHQFTYHYDSPVSQVSTTMRVAPPQHYGLQRRLDLRWHMDPPSDYRHFTDAFGNLVWQLDHARIDDEMVCTVDMRMETQVQYGEDGALIYQGPTPQETDCTVDPVEFTRLTRLVDQTKPLMQLADRARNRGLTQTELADSFLHQVHIHMRYEPGVTHVGTTATEAFTRGAGVCQDFAHVMLSLCRIAGLPARYISGYLPGEGQMHAWIEVLLPEGIHNQLIWVPYDPTHQRRCDERYITVAIGRDYQDIAPTSGYYSGEANNSLDVMVSVVMDTHGPTNRWNTALMIPQAAASHSEDNQ